MQTRLTSKCSSLQYSCTLPLTHLPHLCWVETNHRETAAWGPLSSKNWSNWRRTHPLEVSPRCSHHFGNQLAHGGPQHSWNQVNIHLRATRNLPSPPCKQYLFGVTNAPQELRRLLCELISLIPSLPKPIVTELAIQRVSVLSATKRKKKKLHAK